MTRSEYFERWAELHGGLDPRTSIPVQGWLTVTYVLAKPLVLLRMSPNAVTMLGMLASLLMIGITTIMWFVRLEGRIDRTIERQAWFEAETRRDQARNAQALSELKEAIKNENGKTQAAVDRVLTYLLERNRGVQ